MRKPRYRVELQRFRYYGEFSHSYAIVDIHTHQVLRSGFSSEWTARLWFVNESGFSILDLEGIKL